MVLPIRDSHDDNSTEAPEDEEKLFDREEALRYDEEIMDFPWFSTITWDEIRNLRGTTYVQPPTRLRFALQQAQHAILRAILYNGPSSSMSEPAWKVLLLSSWLLLGRPAENASDANCASCLEARLDLFWAEDWPALWAQVRAECDVATITHTRARTEAEQTQSRIRKVATLARSGEKGRALAAARNAPPVQVTKDIVQEITSLYPVDPDPAVPSTTRVSQAFTAEITEQIPITLKRMPRLGEPGPLGMRAEHWYDFGTQAGDSDLYAQIIAHIATATIPGAVLQYLRAGQVTPLAKPTRGTPTSPHDVFLTTTCTQGSHRCQEPLSYCSSWTTTTRRGLQRWSQQDDQIHTVYCGSKPIPSPGRSGPEGSLLERFQTPYAT